LNLKPNGPGKKPPFSLMGILLAVMLSMMLMRALSGPEDASSPANASKMKQSEFLSQVDNHQVQDVTFRRDPSLTAKVVMKDGSTYMVDLLDNDPYLIGELKRAGVSFSAIPPARPSVLMEMLNMFLPILLLAGLWIWMQRSQMARMGGGASPFTMGKSRAKVSKPEENTVTFADVAGCDEAKEEVAEIVDFLRDPKKYEKLGGRIPKGMLLLGPPGTGKTLLARAMAGEAKVPFFTLSGSDFVEMFVGVGAARVRDLFAQAKENAPCIIFIDEIDAVGRKRGGSFGGGNDEREQTLNQMLVEMDGFEASKGIIVIGATNRADVLDEALKRPGRLDRQVTVGLPDIKGREQILRVHARRAPLGADVDLRVVARGTPGFSGADLANLINEAALAAARRNKKMVGQSELGHAIDKIMMGPERKSAVMSMDDLRMTAYHEAGHALIGKLLKLDPLRKVTIMPRGGALGVAISLPERDQHSLSKRQAMGEIAKLYGGRVAEEILAGEDGVTTGASNDFERATQYATRMVKTWGMSKLGVRVFSDPQGDPFSGRGASAAEAPSEETQRKIDAEIDLILNGQLKLVRSLLEEHKTTLVAIAEALLDMETLDGDQVDVLIAGGKLPDYDTVANEVESRRKALGVEGAERKPKEAEKAGDESDDLSQGPGEAIPSA
jgi:cell division protease FtsH